MRRILIPIVVVLGLLLIGLPLIFNIAADWLWFDSQSLGSVYTTRLTAQWLVGGAAALLAAIFIAVNLQIARRSSTPGQIFEGQDVPITGGNIRLAIWAVTIVLAILFGMGAGGQWPTVLSFLNGTPFGQSDAVFKEDVGFYVFTLPFLEALRDWLSSLLLFTAIAVAAVYITGARVTLPTATTATARRAEGGETLLDQLGVAGSPSIDVPRATRPHLSILAAIYLLVFAFGYYLDRYALTFTQRDLSKGATFAGVSYTDANARIPGDWIMFVITIVIAILVLVTVRFRSYRPLLAAGAVWLVAMILVGAVYPAFVQNVQVNANQITLEEPFADNNIKATRDAYGLSSIEVRTPYSNGIGTLDRADLIASPQTVQNVRLWDYRQLESSYQQLQAISTFYNFSDVTIDRYTLDGTYRQVMLAARELDSGRVQGQGWVNRHLRYTHGLGVALSPVNEAVGEGSPRLIVRDIPPTSTVASLNITRPEIYYGLNTTDYVFVNTKQAEFRGSETGSQNVPYEGQGGVVMDSFWKKLLYAYHFGDGNLLLSSDLPDSSRILYNREIKAATELAAPFLRFDDDPYLVISEGKLYWIRDAYTHSDSYPNASAFGGADDALNYLRNSVKVVIDAYSGRMTFYSFDENDPILRTYRQIFPDLFKPRGEFPAALLPHVRYPELLFNLQARMLTLYHMEQPRTFLGREDPWAIAQDGTESRQRNGNPQAAMEPYYNIMKIPGDEQESFLLLLPFTPQNKNNMTAWMAAKSDGADYGKIVLIRFPANQQVSGPQQVVARANQDPAISQLITLLGQRGSAVQLGNLLVLPIGDSILYVQPFYVQAAQAAQPELKRVIVASTSRIVIGNNFTEAINALLSGQGSVIEGDPGTVGNTGTPTTPGTPAPLPTSAPLPTVAGGADLSALTLPQLITLAQQQYEQGQAALRAGDFTAYGQAQDELKRTLDELARRTLTPAPLPHPDPSPGIGRREIIETPDLRRLAWRKSALICQCRSTASSPGRTIALSKGWARVGSSYTSGSTISIVGGSGTVSTAARLAATQRFWMKRSELSGRW